MTTPSMFTVGALLPHLAERGITLSSRFTVWSPEPRNGSRVIAPSLLSAWPNPGPVQYDELSADFVGRRARAGAEP
jgi:hypothetical protein